MSAIFGMHVDSGYCFFVGSESVMTSARKISHLRAHGEPWNRRANFVR